MSKCKACGAKLIWIQQKATGKWMPCDAVPVRFVPDSSGALILVTPKGEVVHGRPTEEKPYQIGYTSHFATCPAAASFRRPRM